ncbi:MAG: HEPN domain-containing protein [Geobacteraceae bacterium]|nr:HEPN domain-containing protein [Geobacteraceae bacterium]
MRQHEQAILLIKKASDDEALLAEILSSSHVSDEIFGFHCQQAAEKLLKALLSQAVIVYPRTHNLRLLMDLLMDAGHALPADLAELDVLTPYGTLFRYEDLPAEVELNREVLFTLIRSLHEFVEKRLS